MSILSVWALEIRKSFLLIDLNLPFYVEENCVILNAESSWFWSWANFFVLDD